MRAVPTRMDQISAEWVSRCLQRTAPGVQVSDVEFLGAHVSWASKHRIRVRYADPTKAAGLPAQFCVKAALENPDRPDANGPSAFDRLYVTEARFYRDLAPTVDLTIPRAFFADTDGTSAVVLMEDLEGPGVTWGSYDRPLGADVVAEVLVQIARLHAAWWDNAATLDQPWLADVLGPIFEALTSAPNWDAILVRPRCQDMPEQFRDRNTVARAVRAMREFETARPHCVLHGDLHIGNLYFRGSRVGILDFQVVSRGRPITDVAYFVAGAMATEDRRASERDLLAVYRDALLANGIDAPAAESLWLDYRRRMVHGLLNYATPGDADQSERYKATVGGRFAAAAQELESLAALGVAG